MEPGLIWEMWTLEISTSPVPQQIFVPELTCYSQESLSHPYPRYSMTTIWPSPIAIGEIRGESSSNRNRLSPRDSASYPPPFCRAIHVVWSTSITLESSNILPEARDNLIIWEWARVYLGVACLTHQNLSTKRPAYSNKSKILQSTFQTSFILHRIWSGVKNNIENSLPRVVAIGL